MTELERNLRPASVYLFNPPSHPHLQISKAVKQFFYGYSVLDPPIYCLVLFHILLNLMHQSFEVDSTPLVVMCVSRIWDQNLKATVISLLQVPKEDKQIGYPSQTRLDFSTVPWWEFCKEMNLASMLSMESFAVDPIIWLLGFLEYGSRRTRNFPKQ